MLFVNILNRSTFYIYDDFLFWGEKSKKINLNLLLCFICISLNIYSNFIIISTTFFYLDN